MSLRILELESRIAALSKMVGQLSQSISELEDNDSGRIEVVKANLENQIESISVRIGQLSSTISTMSGASNAATRIEVIKASLEESIRAVARQVGILSQRVNDLGDMRKITYDSNGNGVVDLAEGIYDGTNQATAAQIESAVDKSHTENKDFYLDLNGLNQVSAAEIRDIIDNPVGDHDHDTSTDIPVRWIYLKGNESTDDSVRMGMVGNDCEWQLRMSGSWERVWSIGIL